MFPMAEQPWCECESCQLRINADVMNWYPQKKSSDQFLWKLVAPAPFTVVLFGSDGQQKTFVRHGDPRRLVGIRMRQKTPPRSLGENRLSLRLQRFLVIYHGHWTCGTVLVAIVLSYRWVDLDDACDSKRFNTIGSTQRSKLFHFSSVVSQLHSDQLPCPIPESVDSRLKAITASELQEWVPWNVNKFQRWPPLWNPWKSFGKPQDNHGKTIGTWWIYQEEWWLSGNLCGFIIAKLVGV